MAAFDWPPGLPLGEEPHSPLRRLCLRLCGPFKQLRPATCFHTGMDEDEEGGGDGGGLCVPVCVCGWGGCHVKKSFWSCTLQFRSCSVPTQIKTSPVAYVNMVPTVLRFNEP